MTLWCAGGTYADVGSPTCTHLVVEERSVKTVPADIQGRPVIVRSEVVQFVVLLHFFVLSLTRLPVCHSISVLFQLNAIFATCVLCIK